VSTYAAFTDTLSPGNRGSSRDGTRYGSPRTVELGQGVSGPAIVLRPALPSGVGNRGSRIVPSDSVGSGSPHARNTV